MLLQTSFSLSVFMSAKIVLVLPFQVLLSSLYSKGRFSSRKSLPSMHFGFALLCDFIGALTELDFRNWW